MSSKASQNRRQFLKTLAMGSLALTFNRCLCGCKTGQCRCNVGKKPNILLIMIDDMGWMDLCCQGNRQLDTPHMDRLASQGMRFTDAYAAAPVCSPTRAAMMTGQSPARLGITQHGTDGPRFWPEDAPLQAAKTRDVLALEHVTLAEHMKAAGYATAFMGKWHLCGKTKKGDQGLGNPDYLPEKQGYDINIGGCALGGPPTFFDPYRICNIPPRKKGEYLPDRLVDEAMTYMQKNRNKPFFLTLWNYTVHWPMEAPQALIDKYEKRKGPGVKDPRYAAMIEALDNAMGRLMKKLDDLGLADDTLVVFTSDNGGYMGVADNLPLRLGKGYLYEGGIRVPMFVRWPGRIKPGTTSAAPVITMDIFSTLLEAAGVTLPAGAIVDGESLMPVLSETGTLKRDALYFHYPNYAWHKDNRLGGAVREGDYKLIQWYDDRSVELYNLKDDIAEANDLAQRMPEKAKALTKKLNQWLSDSGAEMPQPKTPKKD